MLGRIKRNAPDDDSHDKRAIRYARASQPDPDAAPEKNRPVVPAAGLSIPAAGRNRLTLEPVVQSLS